MILALFAALLMQPLSPAAQEDAAPPAAVQADEAQAAAAPATSTAASFIEKGLSAFRARRLAAARVEFEEAVAADPQSAAAAFYLGYTLYKIGEPSRRMNANKERAKELFAKAFSLDPTFQPTFRKAPAK